MKLSSVASLGVLVAVLASAAPASADTMMAAPVVKVNGCGASATMPAQVFTSVFGGPMTQAATPAMLMIDFTNASKKPISSVEFGYVENGKVRAMVKDVGSFSPESTVMHAFMLSDESLLAHAATMTCVPLRVKYADGTTWMNPEMPGK